MGHCFLVRHDHSTSNKQRQKQLTRTALTILCVAIGFVCVFGDTKRLFGSSRRAESDGGSCNTSRNNDNDDELDRSCHLSARRCQQEKKCGGGTWIVVTTTTNTAVVSSSSSSSGRGSRQLQVFTPLFTMLLRLLCLIPFLDFLCQEDPPPTLPPVPGPVAAPVPRPVTQPVLAPSSSLPVIPAGYSERIVIPNPDTPNLQQARSNCPHLATSNLVDWFAPSTWPSGSVPVAGQAVTLPANKQVLLGRSITGVLGVVTIPATSSLIIGEDAAGLEINVAGMNVLGRLVIGSETCRIETPVTITLHGARPSNPVANVPAVTYKGIAVEGSIQLHGKRYFRTWTRLSAPAGPGATRLVLQHAVNWEPGQTIVLVTTAMKDSREWHQNELLTIVSVSGTTVTVAEPIQHQHAANRGYQAEVGLISRMITIQGNSRDSEPTDPDPLNCKGVDRYGNDQAPCPYKGITGFGTLVTD
jgi:G8 domain